MTDFQTVYDSILNRTKDPELCRMFWDAAQDALRRELEKQEPVAISNEGFNNPVKWLKWFPGKRPLYARPIPPPDVRELVEAAKRILTKLDHETECVTSMDAEKLRDALAKWGKV